MSDERKLTVKLPAVMVDYLEREANDAGISVSEYLEIILDEDMAEQEPASSGDGSKK
jgi:hypothetical protein